MTSAGIGVIKSCNLELCAVNKEQISVAGTITLPFSIGNRTYQHRVIIVDGVYFPGAILLGTDLISRLGKLSIDFDEGTIDIRGCKYQKLNEDTNTTLAATVSKPQCEIHENLATVSKNETIEGNSISIVNLRVPYADGTTVLVDSNINDELLKISNTVATVSKGLVPVGIANLSASETQLKVNNKIANVCTLMLAKSEEYVSEEPLTNPPDLSFLNEEKSNEIKAVLQKHKNVISQNKFDIGKCDLVEHYINTGDHPPISTRQWPLPHATRAEMNKQCEQMLQMGVIEPCQSPWQSPTLLVRKSDGSYRYCIDFRSINKISVKDKFPLPKIETVLESLQGAKYFSTLDLRSGYWQIPVAERDRDKTAFSSQNETYRFCRLPFGLHNAPATFQRLMQLILRPVLGKQAFVFLDDVIVFSRSFQEHITDLDNVLSLIKEAGLKVSPEKCSFAKTSIKYLGHIVSSSGIQVDPAKTTAVQNMIEPKNAKEVRRFIGVASYYRRFVQNFSELAAPLTELTRKKAKFEWKDIHQLAFEKIKRALITAPILQYPDYSKQFKLCTDASNVALGSVLTQSYEGVDLPVAYFSRKFNPAETRYTVTEKEALAIVDSVKHFSQYLYGYKFQIVTDHAPLRYLFQYKTTVPRVTRWAFLLSEFDYEITYVSGKNNIVPDALSRAIATVNQMRINETLANPATVFDPGKVRLEQEKDETLKDIINTIEGTSTQVIDPRIIEQYTLSDGCLYLLETIGTSGTDEFDIKLRLVVPQSLRQNALLIAHDSTLDPAKKNIVLALCKVFLNP